MKSETSAEEAQMFQWQFDKMRHKHIILPQNTHTHKHAHMHRVLNDGPRFNYHTKYKILHTFKFHCRSVTSLRIIDLRCEFNQLSVTTDSGRKHI